MRAGHVGEEAVRLARSGAEIFAIDTTCTHYGAPLADGLMVGDTVRVPGITRVSAFVPARPCTRRTDAK